MRDRIKDENYFNMLIQKEKESIIRFEDAVKKITLEKGTLDRGVRNGYSILINSYEKEINSLYSLGEIWQQSRNLTKNYCFIIVRCGIENMGILS